LASGQVIRILSTPEDGRGSTYRTLIVRAGADGETNLRLVMQKVLRDEELAYSLDGEELEARPVDPKTSVTDVVLGEVGDNSAFFYTLRDSTGHTQKCTFDFDISSAGTPTTADHFHCDDAQHPAAKVVTMPTPPSIDGIPLATGRVTQMLSEAQNGRQITYRALVMRAGDDADKNLAIVIQKVENENTDGSVHNVLLDSLLVPPTSLPGGTEDEIGDITLFPIGGDTDGFTFQLFDGAPRTCKFDFDGSSAGTPTTIDHFRCDSAGAAR
jgi:hypothetical protein